MRVVLIDNYDSFVYNLAQYLGAAGAEPMVLRSSVGLDEVADEHPDALVISPGPGRPEQAGCSVEVVRRFAGEVPILGVCLGHQAIGVAYGASVVGAPEVMHGKTSEIEHDGKGVLAGVPTPLTATRYHSLVVDPSTIPEDLEVTATADGGVVMGLRHRGDVVEGVQFHPESALTPLGMRIVENFLKAPATPRPGS
jgi:anthranilate synthase/aminodeoxychorismate synthase-like glutamine amidotransferase